MIPWILAAPAVPAAPKEETSAWVFVLLGLGLLGMGAASRRRSR